MCSSKLCWLAFLLGLGVHRGSLVNAETPVNAVQSVQDITMVESFYYRYGPRPSASTVARVMARAEIANPDPAAMFCATVLASERLISEPLDVRAMQKKAADAGHRPSKSAYAMGLVTGEHGPANARTGLALLRELSDQGDALADCYLGVIHHRGLPEVVEPDLVKAEKFFRRSVERGMLRSLSNLAQIALERGQDEATLAATTQAAMAGDGQMVRRLMLWHGGHEKFKDPAKLLYWTRRGAMLGYPDCMMAYVYMLDDGHDGPADPTLMASLVLRSAERGNLEAIAMLEVARISGRFGIAPDSKLGMANLRLLAAENNPVAQFWLGRMLWELAPVADRQAWQSARDWVVKAAVVGHNEAKEWIKSHQGDKIDATKAP